MDKYSVLMSVYRKVEPIELSKSIESMINQTVFPDQFIIVLDGPIDDKLKKVINCYEKENPNLFTIVELNENKGLAVALNEGIKVSRNELIARMDSDDYSLPERCETQLYEFKKNPELDLLGANTQHFIDNPEKPLDAYAIHPIGIKNIKKTIRRNSAFSHPTVMFRKSAVVKCGCYDADLRRSQDHDLFTRMIYEGCMVDNIDKTLVLFRADADCMLRNRNQESCKARIIIQKRLLKRKQCSIIDYLYVRLGVVVAQILPEKIYIFIYSLVKEKA